MIKKIYFLSIIFIFSFYSIHSQEINWSFELKDSSFGQTAAGDIDGDGKLELVFGCYRNDGNIYVLNSEDGTLLWKYNTSIGGNDACNDVAPIIFDCDGDGKLEVIVPSSCTPKTYCFNGKDGSIKWIAETRGSDSPPTIADIDNDGKFEVLHGEFGGYVLCLNVEDGTRKWELAVDTHSWIQTAPTIVDLDNDGNFDFVVATWNAVKGDTNRVYTYRGYDQKLLWTHDIEKYAYHGTTVADLDDDDKPELIIGDYVGRLYALNGEDGSLQWDFMDDVPVYIGSPISVGDVDGDGHCDLVFCDGYKIVAINRFGNFMWRFTIPNGQTAFRGVALSDISGDGKLDVLFGASNGHAYGITGSDGSLIFDYDFNNITSKSINFNNAPIISDFNNDDTLDMFIVGGQTSYPDFSKNYGYAFSFPIGKGTGPDWLMFQKNIRRTSSDWEYSVSVKDNNVNLFNKIAYPNPFSEKIIIDLSNFESVRKVEIFDILGNLIQNLEFRENIVQKQIEWDGTNLNGIQVLSGYYFAEVTTFKNKYLVKLIKK